MSKGVDGLLDDYYRQRWSSVSAPAAGTTCVASAGIGAGLATNKPMSNKARNILEAVVFSVKNLTAAATTVVMKVSEASIAGTVLASVELVVGIGATASDCYSQWYIPGTRGNDLVVSFDTVQASVVMKLNPCGWTETSTSG